MHYKWHSCVCLTHNKNVKHNVSVTSIKTTFSLINGRDETLFACVLHHFYMFPWRQHVCEQHISSGTFLWKLVCKCVKFFRWRPQIVKPREIYFIITSSPLKLARMEMKLGMHPYYIVSMMTTCLNNKNSLRHFSFNTRIHNPLGHTDVKIYYRICLVMALVLP